MKGGEGVGSLRGQKKQKETDETVTEAALGGRRGRDEEKGRESREDRFQGFVRRMSLSPRDSV